MHIVGKSILDWLWLGLPTTASGVTQQGTWEIMLLLVKIRAEREEEASEEAAGSVERKTLTHKGGYLKY